MPTITPVSSQGEPSLPHAHNTTEWPQAFLPQIAFAALIVVLFTLAFQHPGLVIKRPYARFTPDFFYMRGIYRFYTALFGTFITAWLLQPAASVALTRWQTRTDANTQRRWAIAAIACACVLFSAFVIIFGRWQFGGFDYNILTEVGWRQILGQHPYVDFPTTSPPLFNLGIWLAFRLFGVTWDGMLIFTSLFTVLTLLWIYALLRRLNMTAFAALGTACTIEVVTMLSCCFWWYNNSTLLLAAIFFLSSLLLTRPTLSRFAQSSYVVSLALLSLAKPNIAGVTILGCVILLLIAATQRTRIVLLTLLGTACSLLIFKAAHISIPAMLTTYRGAAKERGAFSSFGYDEYAQGFKRMIQLWYFALCLPLLVIIKPLRSAVRGRDFRTIAMWLFFPLAALIAIYGLRGNGELYDMETTALVASLGLLAFAWQLDTPLLRRFTVALFCAMAASNLYTGISRDRVYTIGGHMFFEWKDRNHVIASGRLKNMRVSETFLEVNEQIQQALTNNPGPYFFGPRVDYSYMAFGLPSPLHFPAWWHPGTAFDRADMHKIVAGWEQRRFPTLIYFKGSGMGFQTPTSETPGPMGEQSTDYTYYPQSMLDDLRTLYIRDDRYPRITVYHRRPGM